MRILYGVSGEGFGHSSRAKEIIPFLLKKKNEIMIITYGQAYDVLKEVKGIKILRVEGIELFFKEGKGLSLKRTFFYNIKRIAKNIKNFDKIIAEVDSFKPEMAISDMEPIVPIIRYWKKLPLICFDNQHRITHLSLKVPKRYNKEYVIAREAVKRTISRADHYIILSFTKEKIKQDREKTNIVDPILREDILRLDSKERDYVLVYLTKKDDSILKILRKLNEKFIVYGYNVEIREGNLEFRRTGKGFLRDLADCKAIIASAGFTLMSEALYLKKPYFAVPLKGQFEQTLNALFLEQADLGDFSEQPTKKELERFLLGLSGFRKNLKKYRSNPKEVFEVLEKILEALKPTKQQLY